MKTTHIAYSDESHQNIGQYHAVGMVSLPAENAMRISQDIKEILEQSQVNEVQWKKIKGTRESSAAIKVISYSISEARLRNVRVDVLIWDTNDERHSIPGRDDNKNLQNMYIQLFKNVFRKRWPIESTWQIFPDKNSAIDWNFLQNTLANTDRFSSKLPNLMSDEWFSLRTHFGIQEIAEVNSKDTYIAQVADIFAGMGVFSYRYFNKYHVWALGNSPQLALFENESCEFTSKEEEHSKVLKAFIQRATNFSLGISLDSSQGLLTHNPNNPINFWLYKPQRQYDKAPTRITKKSIN